MPLPIPLEPPITRTCLPPKSSSFIVSLEFSGYAENITANGSGKKRMSDFKQLSRSVSGLTVLVTGAASGMGRATALVFAAEGAKVAATYYAAEGAQGVAAEIAASGGTGKAWALALANPEDITSLVNATDAHFGSPDYVLH